MQKDSSKDLRRLQRAIMVYACLGTLLITGLSIIFALTPLYSRMYTLALDRATRLTEHKANLLRLFLNRSQHDAVQLVNVRNAYSTKQDIYPAPTEKVRYDPPADLLVNQDQTLAGVTAFNATGSILWSSGINIPESKWQSLIFSKNSDAADSLIEIDGNYYIISALPVSNEKDRSYFALFDTATLAQAVSQFVKKDDESRDEEVLILYSPGKADIILSLDLDKGVLLPAGEELKAQMKHLVPRDEVVNHIKNFNTSDKNRQKDKLISLALIPKSRLAVVSVFNYSNILSTVNNRIIILLIGSAIIAVLGSIGLYYLIGELAQLVRRIYDETSRAKNELNIEVQERKAIELVLRENEEQAKHAAYEKEVLLRELHHRVKNNLQLVSSLLSLQNYEIDCEPNTNILRDSQNRVKSIALLHDNLYLSNNLNKVDFLSYLSGITKKLVSSYSLMDSVECKVKGEAIELDLDKAVSCGLVVNELVTNALKHAFPGKRSGSILVNLRKDGSNCIISVRDNGKGGVNNQSFRNPSSLGNKLVAGLAKQLQGQISVQDVNHGAQIELSFKL